MNSGQDRTIVGLTFDPKSTATNLILWVTDNYMYTGSNDVPDWSSKLDRLTGANLQTGQNVLLNLPRSAHDHEANSIAFGPDGALYFAMGSNSGMGYADQAWANRSEVELSGAILRVDTAALPTTLPLDVKTTDGGGTYNPWATGAPVTLYATGVRNAFDLVFHSYGQLYAPTNGSAAGANLPAVANPLPATCANRSDAGTAGPYAYTGPTFSTIFGNPNAQTDFIHKIAKGGYYGHPNPSRCEFIAYGGNPTSGTDAWEDTQYPVGVQPDRNYRAADVYDGGMHASADGTIEFKSNVFGGKLKGKLLIVRYSASKDIEVADPSGPNGTITGIVTGVTGFNGFSEPLDITENPNGSGILYVTELGGYDIKLLRPIAG
jgi:glucose/arabinose dehydrogenase